jgi:hypothetical protein
MAVAALAPESAGMVARLSRAPHTLLWMGTEDQVFDEVDQIVVSLSGER